MKTAIFLLNRRIRQLQNKLLRKEQWLKLKGGYRNLHESVEAKKWIANTQQIILNLTQAVAILEKAEYDLAHPPQVEEIQATQA